MRNTDNIITDFTGEENRHRAKWHQRLREKALRFCLELLDLGVLTFIYLLVKDKCNATMCEYSHYCIWLICELQVIEKKKKKGRHNPIFQN